MARWSPHVCPKTPCAPSRLIPPSLPSLGRAGSADSVHVQSTAPTQAHPDGVNLSPPSSRHCTNGGASGASRRSCIPPHMITSIQPCKRQCICKLNCLHPIETTHSSIFVVILPVSSRSFPRRDMSPTLQPPACCQITYWIPALPLPFSHHDSGDVCMHTATRSQRACQMRSSFPSTLFSLPSSRLILI